MGKYLIFATLGTSHFPFTRMLREMSSLLASLEEGYEIVIQRGNTDPIDLPSVKEIRSFFSRSEMEDLYRRSDLVFSHCGIGSIFNSLKYNRPTVIFTRLSKYAEFTDDHQLQIANEIEINPLIMVHRDEDVSNVVRFKELCLAGKELSRKERDLINYPLAKEIADVLYQK